MIENNMRLIEGVGIYPIISLFIFLSFFITLIVWVLRVDKNYLGTMSTLPLDANSVNDNKNYGDSNEK
jgi:hypothetical protein